MNENIRLLEQELDKREYRARRTQADLDVTEDCAGRSLSDCCVIKLRRAFAEEKLEAFPGDRFGFRRSNATRPSAVEEDGKRHSPWGPGNVTPDYAGMIGAGTEEYRRRILEKQKEFPASEFLKNALTAPEIMEQAADLMRKNAEKAGCEELARALTRVPRLPARTLYEALVFMKVIIFVLRLNENVHLTLGRFDQYMYPFYRASREAGETAEDLQDMITEFFLTLNFDTDLYQGVQQGDNGQSMVLGGCRRDGSDGWNELSEICLEASRRNRRIDPKINLRVDKNTPFQRYLKGTELTRQGLGFPQYSNDDVVIPGLIALGYDPEDARDYAVAACWEFIIPAYGMDIPNLVTMNFPLAVERATNRLEECETFDAFLAVTDEEIRKLARERMDMTFKVKSHLRPDPVLSVFLRPCIDVGKDVAEGGAKYNNDGMHGAGISVAVDALCAIRSVIYEQKTVSKQTLLAALAADYEGYDDLRQTLLEQPKFGGGDPITEQIACRIMETFEQAVNNQPNSRGGIWRAGTGSAHEYIFSANQVGATADGKKAKSPFGCSYSPSLNANPKGILTVFRSFTKPDLSKIINGGPVTIEIHDTAFRNEDGVEKVAKLVQLFVALKGHQLQLNAINRDQLLDAQKHPEDHKNLIVRVWGWSGYFNELDKMFQDHIIARTEFGL